LGIFKSKLKAEPEAKHYNTMHTTHSQSQIYARPNEWNWERQKTESWTELLREGSCIVISSWNRLIDWLSRV